eukprot:m.74481 g.74481  ORF g.74481 m.74481 type:complete len:114 (-) comp24662_c1_seq3:164-505(-)
MATSTIFYMFNWQPHPTKASPKILKKDALNKILYCFPNVYPSLKLVCVMLTRLFDLPLGVTLSSTNGYTCQLNISSQVLDDLDSVCKNGTTKQQWIELFEYIIDPIHNSLPNC